MGCGQSSDTDNSNSTKSTKIIPNKSTPSNDNNNTFNGSKGGFSQRMFRNKNKTNSKTKEIKHAGDFAVILKNGSFIVIEAGIAIGKFGEYHVGVRSFLNRCVYLSMLTINKLTFLFSFSVSLFQSFFPIYLILQYHYHYNKNNKNNNT